MAWYREDIYAMWLLFFGKLCFLVYMYYTHTRYRTSIAGKNCAYYIQIFMVTQHTWHPVLVVISVVRILLLLVSIILIGYLKKTRSRFFVTNVYKFLITAQHYNTGSMTPWLSRQSRFDRRVKVSWTNNFGSWLPRESSSSRKTAKWLLRRYVTSGLSDYATNARRWNNMSVYNMPTAKDSETIFL